MSQPIPLGAKIAVAVLLVVVFTPLLVTLLVLAVLGAMGGAGVYANQRYVAQSRASEIRLQVAALARGAAEAKLQGALQSCGSSEGAMEAARAGGSTKVLLRPEEPSEACLLALGGASWPTYGRYWVEIASDGQYTVHGVVDLDEDGELLHVAMGEGETSMRELSED